MRFTRNGLLEDVFSKSSLTLGRSKPNLKVTIALHQVETRRRNWAHCGSTCGGAAGFGECGGCCSNATETLTRRQRTRIIFFLAAVRI